MNLKCFTSTSTKTGCVISFIVPFVILIAVWELISGLNIVDTTLLPAPHAILSKAYELTRNTILLKHVGYSFYRLFVGLILGIVFGILSGALIGSSNISNDMFSPLMSIFITIPTIAIVPILLITLGVGDSTIIVSIFLACFFPVAYGTIAGIRGIKRQYLLSAKIMGANRASMFKNVLLPGSITSLLPGLRLAIGYSWGALVGAEMLGANKWGIGQMIFSARTFYAVDVMFVGLATIAIGGFIMNKVVITYIEQKTIVRWGLIAE